MADSSFKVFFVVVMKSEMLFLTQEREKSFEKTLPRFLA